MSEKMEISAESIDRVKQAAMEFKDTILSHFKDNMVEVKDWKFAIENVESSYVIDAAIKIVIKPKAKTQ